MCGKTSTQTQSKQKPPDWIKRPYLQLIRDASKVADNKYEPYQGQLVANMNKDQMAAFADMRNLGSTFQPYLNRASSLSMDAAKTINPMQFSQGAISQYMDPYRDMVVDATLKNINNANEVQRQNLVGNAIAKGAFGGDRAGMAQAELARNQALSRDQTVANLLSQGYGQALGMFNTQQSVNLAADQNDAMRKLQAAQAQAGLGQQSLGSNLQAIQAQLQGGMLQQQQDQNQLSALYQQWQNKQAYPFQSLGWLGNIVTGVGNNAGGTTTTTTPPPSPWSTVAGLGMAGLGLLSDERVKEGIAPIGETYDGQKIYKYRYKGDPRTQIGLLAQEVEEHYPEAVGSVGGIKTVDYDRATESAAHEAAEHGRFASGGAMGTMGAMPYGSAPMAGMGGLMLPGPAGYVPEIGPINSGRATMPAPVAPQAQANPLGDLAAMGKAGQGAAKLWDSKIAPAVGSDFRFGNTPTPPVAPTAAPVDLTAGTAAAGALPQAAAGAVPMFGGLFATGGAVGTNNPFLNSTAMTPAPANPMARGGMAYGNRPAPMGQQQAPVSTAGVAPAVQPQTNAPAVAAPGMELQAPPAPGVGVSAGTPNPNAQMGAAPPSGVGISNGTPAQIGAAPPPPVAPAPEPMVRGGMAPEPMARGVAPSIGSPQGMGLLAQAGNRMGPAIGAPGAAPAPNYAGMTDQQAWMQTRGDPRGALAAFAQAASNGPGMRGGFGSDGGRGMGDAGPRRPGIGGIANAPGRGGKQGFGGFAEGGSIGAIEDAFSRFYPTGDKNNPVSAPNSQNVPTSAIEGRNAVATAMAERMPKAGPTPAAPPAEEFPEIKARAKGVTPAVAPSVAAAVAPRGPKPTTSIDRLISDPPAAPAAGVGGLMDRAKGAVSGAAESFKAGTSVDEAGKAYPSSPLGRVFGMDSGLFSPEARQGLLAAGLATMASRSPNPFTAIGEGGLKGVEAYNTALTGSRDQQRIKLSERQLQQQADQFQAQLKQQEPLVQAQAGSLNRGPLEATTIYDPTKPGQAPIDNVPFSTPEQRPGGIGGLAQPSTQPAPVMGGSGPVAPAGAPPAPGAQPILPPGPPAVPPTAPAAPGAAPQPVPAPAKAEAKLPVGADPLATNPPEAEVLPRDRRAFTAREEFAATNRRVLDKADAARTEYVTAQPRLLQMKFTLDQIAKTGFTAQGPTKDARDKLTGLVVEMGRIFNIKSEGLERAALEVSRAEDLRKVVNVMAGELSARGDQNSYQALRTMMESVPTGKMSAIGADRIMAGLIAIQQRNKDFADYVTTVRSTPGNEFASMLEAEKRFNERRPPEYYVNRAHAASIPAPAVKAFLGDLAKGDKTAKEEFDRTFGKGSSKAVLEVYGGAQ